MDDPRREDSRRLEGRAHLPSPRHASRQRAAGCLCGELSGPQRSGATPVMPVTVSELAMRDSGHWTA
ncbi:MULTISPECIES: hypothetical protein [unclassified Nonomuraea]|uniref:hypothetical protein n=1 Tax=unclassified Nonomuraea TaxID=2593643 RepID=UPI0033FA7E4A